VRILHHAKRQHNESPSSSFSMRLTRILFRLVLAFVGLALLLLITLLLWPDPKTKAPPPLPFDTNSLVACVPHPLIPLQLPPHPTMGQRLAFRLFKLSQALSSSKSTGTWSFAASPIGPCMIQGLLNECANASGTNYYLPLKVTTGTVRFGNTNTLDGPHWVSAFEHALQTGNPDWWNSEAKRREQENLVLIRYPEQKAILVLPASAAREFRKTNSTGIIVPPP
jgi:hypothetical protein